MSVVKGEASISTTNFDKLEIVLGSTLGNGRIGVLQQVRCLVAGYLRLRAGVLGMRNALLGHPTKCLRHFHIRQVEFWNPVIGHAKRGGSVRRRLGSGGGSR